MRAHVWSLLALTLVQALLQLLNNLNWRQAHTICLWKRIYSWLLLRYWDHVDIVGLKTDYVYLRLVEAVLHSLVVHTRGVE